MQRPCQLLNTKQILKEFSIYFLVNLLALAFSSSVSMGVQIRWMLVHFIFVFLIHIILKVFLH